MANNERARDALNAIPADIPRDEWVRVGMAAHAAGLDFDAFNDWSVQASNYSERDARDTWRSFKPGKGVGAGTLFKTAAQNGWRPDGRSATNSPVPSPRKPQERAKPTGQGVDPAEVWERCLPATAEHPYIQQKQGLTDGLRVIPSGDALKVAGESMVGALVIPVRRPDGSVSSLQLIAPPETAARLKAEGRPGKLNLPGCTMQGWFMVGEQSQGSTVYLCEGIGQAWAAWKATGRPAVVCFGWGRVRAVAMELREADPSARLVIVPDVGKEQDADAVARELQVQFIRMPDDWPHNADINDLAQRDGLDTVEALLSSPKAPEQRYKLLSASDLAALPPLAWRVRGVLPAAGLAGLYGPSASGKSFLALDMAAAIAEGARWFDCRTEGAPVVYAALEGESGFRVRVAAWEAHRGRSLPKTLHMVLQPFKLTEPRDVHDLAAVIPAGAVVFLDTLNRAAPTSDENSSKDMGEILEAAKHLQALTVGLVVLVHHTGKDSTRGLRGHSSLFAAMDAAVEVSREGDRREWRVAKSKDGADGDVKAFRLQVETLGTDDYGDAITSCVVVPDKAAEEVQRAKLPTGGNQRLVLDALRPMFKDGQTGKSGAPPLRPCIELEAAIAKAAVHLTCETHRRNTRAREAITGLVSRGVLGCHEGWLWQC
ncbi:AAA family ATPase [Caenimonas soli]|uniref:AAA family ATPase n=1 Tax=Caenimonas soli TaxID=2735555 RepID=UPI001552868D|nr:AAA family ATPase [Caenimonas soli]NPC57850.1 AAA family ATPase [Caenimonas soli]